MRNRKKKRHNKLRKLLMYGIPYSVLVNYIKKRGNSYKIDKLQDINFHLDYDYDSLDESSQDQTEK